MRVLHVIPSISAAHGGPSRAMGLIEEALVAEGVEVETVTTDDNGPGRRLDYEPAQRGAGPAGSPRWFFPKESEFYKRSRPLVRWVTENLPRFDLVHVHALFSHTSVAAARRAWQAEVPYIVRPLGVLNRYGMQRRRAFLKRFSLRFVEAPILKRAAAIHFTDEAERSEAEELGIPFHSEIIPLGIPPAETGSRDRFLEDHPQLAGHSLVLFLSRIDPKKGLDILFEAVARGEEVKCRLVIAGDGKPDYVEQLKRLAGSLGIAARVTWLGRIDGAEKANAFAAADVYVLPSHSENFGIALAEALSHGLPCISTRGVAISQAIAEAEAGLVVETASTAVADAITALLRDEPLRRKLGTNARALVASEYSLEAMGKRLVKMYERILARAR